MSVINQNIKKIVLEVLNISNIDTNDSPETVIEWDSFAQIVLFSAFSKKFSIQFNDDEILSFYTYGELINLVQIKCKN